MIRAENKRASENRKANNGLRAVALAVVVMFTLSACVSTSFYTSPTLPEGAENRRIVIMPVDVELSELTAAGLAVPKADWTETAHGHVVKALTAAMKDRTATVVSDASGTRTAALDHKQLQLVKLHGAVGRSISIHQYLPNAKLPTKKDGFDWTLGPDARVLKQAYDADFALFIFMRDSYSSSGRVAVIIFAALFGVSVPGGVQLGFASLVDLNTGQIVWFNRLARAEGDLRSAEPAAASIDLLLKDFPK
jgi:hypothetical protein